MWIKTLTFHLKMKLISIFHKNNNKQLWKSVTRKSDNHGTWTEFEGHDGTKLKLHDYLISDHKSTKNE